MPSNNAKLLSIKEVEEVIIGCVEEHLQSTPVVGHVYAALQKIRHKAIDNAVSAAVQTFEVRDKYRILKELSTPITLRMNDEGVWEVHHHVCVVHNNAIIFYGGKGETSDAAILDHWENLTNLAPGDYIAKGYFNERKAYVWQNGWIDVTAKVNAKGQLKCSVD